MSDRIFKAFVYGKEIKFHVGGKEASQVWGGDTLLWEKQTKSYGDSYNYIVSSFQHFVPVSSWYECSREYALPFNNAIRLNRSNIEIGFYGEEEWTSQNNENLYSAKAYWLVKAKTQEVKDNIQNIYFKKFYCDVDSKDAYYPGIAEWEKVPAKLIYGDNVFSIDSYSTGDGIIMHSRRSYNYSLTTPARMLCQFNISKGDSEIPVLKKFDTKEKLLTWAVS